MIFLVRIPRWIFRRFLYSAKYQLLPFVSVMPFCVMLISDLRRQIVWKTFVWQ